MSLAAINSQYSGLNGLAGYGTYGANGLYTGVNKEVVKDNIADSYDIGATSTSYANKSAASSSSFAQQCQTIDYLLKEGRTDDAMAKYNELYNDMQSNPYYQNYSENEIKTLLQEKYISATGSSLVNDASQKGVSSFEAGFTSSLPVFGLMCNGSSKDELIAEVTGTGVSKGAQVTSGAGIVTGITTGAAAAGALTVGYNALKNGNTKVVSNGLKAIKDGWNSGGGLFKRLGSIVSNVAKKSTGKKALVATGVAAGLGVLTYIGNKLFSLNNNKTANNA